MKKHKIKKKNKINCSKFLTKFVVADSILKRNWRLLKPANLASEILVVSIIKWDSIPSRVANIVITSPAPLIEKHIKQKKKI